MRQDQYVKVYNLSEKITDVALSDGDPDNWAAAGKSPKEMTKEERGDAYWSRKMAIGTFSVLSKVTELLQRHQDIIPPGDDNDRLLEDEISSAEREGARLLDEMQRQTSKARYDKNVHGE